MNENASGRQLNYEKLVGQFDCPRQRKVFSLIEKHAEIKQKYSKKDWLNVNRDEIPQTFLEYHLT